MLFGVSSINIAVQRVLRILRVADHCPSRRSPQVMGASFRNTDEICELAGCDRLTIAPKLLDELSKSHADVPRKLDASKAKEMDIPKIDMNEKTFRWMMNEDAMATEKLAEGIRGFAVDIVKLEKIVQARIDAAGNKRRKLTNEDKKED